MGKKGGKKLKRKLEETEEVEKDEVILPPKRMSDEPPPKRVKWINKTRALVFAARGITHRDRHLLQDIRTLMPHSKPENKLERKENLSVINELCDMKHCNKSIFFESRKKKDLYMWVSNVPEGPSAKFLVESTYTMAELKLTGNCLKGSRPLLSFSENFSTEPHYVLLKELFTQVFGVPNHHPKSQPFIDKVITFTVMDNRIWYRNYQIVTEDGALAEIGPRFVMNPIKIFKGSFGGETIWENEFYVTPTLYRRQLAMAASEKYKSRKYQKEQFIKTQPKVPSYVTLPEDEIFDGDAFEVASKLAGQKSRITKPRQDASVPGVSLKKKKRGSKINKKKSIVNNSE